MFRKLRELRNIRTHRDQLSNTQPIINDMSHEEVIRLVLNIDELNTIFRANADEDVLLLKSEFIPQLYNSNH